MSHEVVLLVTASGDMRVGMGIINKLPFDFKPFLQNENEMAFGEPALLFAALYFSVGMREAHFLHD